MLTRRHWMAPGLSPACPGPGMRQGFLHSPTTLRPPRPDLSRTSSSRSHPRQRAALLRWPARRGRWLLEGGRRLASPPPLPTPRQTLSGVPPSPGRRARARPDDPAGPARAGHLSHDRGRGRPAGRPPRASFPACLCGAQQDSRTRAPAGARPPRDSQVWPPRGAGRGGTEGGAAAASAIPRSLPPPPLLRATSPPPPPLPHRARSARPGASPSATMSK